MAYRWHVKDGLCLLQDMTQPQHARNDPYAGERFDSKTGLRGHKSVYESNINALATGGQFTTLGFSTSPSLDQREGNPS